ncbi:FcbC Predicted thioesterase [Candidatus Nanopelagicaceae bacterium]|jgi:acyl-CoA thioester hydrolase
MRHLTKTHVRWDDLDGFGHVNNATYLTYMQESRSNFTWYSRKEAGLDPVLSQMVVARAEVDFIEPIYDGGFDLDVAIWVSRIGNSSFEMVYEMSSSHGMHARGRTVQVAVNMDTKKSRPLSDEEREFLNKYLEE